MKYLVKIALFFAIIIFCIACSSRHHWKNEMILSFNNDEMNAWSEVFISKYVKSEITTQKSQWNIINRKINNKIRNNLVASFQRRLIIVNNDNNQVLLSFRTRGSFVRNAFATVSFYDSLQQLIKSDTMNLVCKSNFSWKNKLFVNIQSAYYLKLKINVIGEEDSIPMNSNADNIFSSFSVDSCVIKSDYPFRRLSETKRPINDVFYTNSRVEGLTLKNKSPIIAIGKSMEGVDDFDAFTFKFIQKAIQEDSIDLVLLNLPMDRLLIADRYIQGDSLYNLEQALTVFEETPYSFYRTCLFLDFLKSYNDQHINKVHISGYETTSEADELYKSLPDFFFPQMIADSIVISDSIMIERILSTLLNTPIWESPNQGLRLYNIFSQNSFQLTSCTKKEVNLLYYYINQLRWNINNKINENKLDAENIDYLLKNYSHFNKAIVYGDLESLMKRGISIDDDSKSVGQYIYEKYHDDYKVLGLLANKGTARVLSDEGLYKNVRLLKSMLSSVEANVITDSLIAFAPTLNLSDPMMIRTKIDVSGSYNGAVVNPSFSLNAFMFFKKVFASKIIDSDLENNYDKATLLWKLSKRYDVYNNQINGSDSLRLKHSSANFSLLNDSLDN